MKFYKFIYLIWYISYKLFTQLKTIVNFVLKELCVILGVFLKNKIEQNLKLNAGEQ